MAIHKPNNVPVLHSLVKDKMEWFEKSITNITSLTYLPYKIHLGYRLDNCGTGPISGTEKRLALRPTQSNIPCIPCVSFLGSKVVTTCS